jgi:hypothetical protein
VGAWSALGVVGLRLASPRAGRVVATVLATSAVNDFLQAGFAWIRDGANAATHQLRESPDSDPASRAGSPSSR